MSASVAAPRISCPVCGQRVTLRKAATRWHPEYTHRALTSHYDGMRGEQCRGSRMRFDLTSSKVVGDGRPCKAYGLDEAEAMERVVREALHTIEGDDDVVSFGLRIARLALACKHYRTVTDDDAS